VTSLPENVCFKEKLSPLELVKQFCEALGFDANEILASLTAQLDSAFQELFETERSDAIAILKVQLAVTNVVALGIFVGAWYTKKHPDMVEVKEVDKECLNQECGSFAA